MTDHPAPKKQLATDMNSVIDSVLVLNDLDSKTAIERLSAMLVICYGYEQLEPMLLAELIRVLDKCKSKIKREGK